MCMPDINVTINFNLVKFNQIFKFLAFACTVSKIFSNFSDSFKFKKFWTLNIWSKAKNEKVNITFTNYEAKQPNLNLKTFRFSLVRYCANTQLLEKRETFRAPNVFRGLYYKKFLWQLWIPHCNKLERSSTRAYIFRQGRSQPECPWWHST